MTMWIMCHVKSVRVPVSTLPSLLRQKQGYVVRRCLRRKGILSSDSFIMSFLYVSAICSPISTHVMWNYHVMLRHQQRNCMLIRSFISLCMIPALDKMPRNITARWS
uniref:Uncharacterized protein n=1 Tax=Opuntia streptacantha TaxID=393608 RepID=A0A7C9DZQ4_OPUST